MGAVGADEEPRTNLLAPVRRLDGGDGLVALPGDATQRRRPQDGRAGVRRGVDQGLLQDRVGDAERAERERKIVGPAIGRARRAIGVLRPVRLDDASRALDRIVEKAGAVELAHAPDMDELAPHAVDVAWRALDDSHLEAGPRQHGRKAGPGDAAAADEDVRPRAGRGAAHGRMADQVLVSPIM